MGNVVLDVHVKQYDMHMWSSTTCACGTVRHVHVKQDCAPGKVALLAEKDKVKHRATVMIVFKKTPHIKKIHPIIHRTDMNNLPICQCHAVYSAANWHIGILAN